MSFLEDEGGQGAAEYILLFGGVIVIAISALYVYYEYVNKTVPGITITQDISTVRSSANG